LGWVLHLVHGKLHQHSNAIPVIGKKCIGCGECVAKCPVNAITLEGNKAVINPDLCIGCASCSATCEINAIGNSWDRSNFLEKLAEYAYGAQIDKTNIYFNFVFNITDGCDCMGEHMELVAPNIGIFAGTDPVAIDTASLDKLQVVTKSKMFDTARATLKHAEKIGLGEMEYKVIEV